MRIRTDFGLLWQSVKQMGAEERDFTFDMENPQDLEIDDQLERGIEIKLDDLETTGGLLSYKGRQILLYIPDQGRRISDVLADPETGRKFHVADCRTLNDMRGKGRFERYVITNELSGVFKVSGQDPYSGFVEGEAALTVCKNCLSCLNYQGYQSESSARGPIYKGFTLDAFFKTYSTKFRYLPKRNTNRKGAYSDDWAEISRSFRARKNWTCEECRVDLTDARNLLHTHHEDGNKHNNIASNLRALCIDCHRKQAMHDSMVVSRSDMEAILRLRREQELLDDISRWDEVLELIDTAYDGVARKIMRTSRSLPEVAGHIQNAKGEVVITPQLSWPGQKYAIVDDDKELEILASVGWRGETVESVLKQ